ncbi:MAG: MATE family efflux transporter [Clostridia bacterium]|nr:MATE family efflux transporter [Clostridia bacterium]
MAFGVHKSIIYIMRTDYDMTKGSITRHIIAYAIPMILGNILQLTYNAVDSMIISKFIGENALAAVSTSNPVMTIMILGASGVGMGASIIISRLYGADEKDKIKREFSTTAIFGLFFSLLVFIAGFIFSGAILKLINTPDEVFGEALVYLRIMFVGFLFTFQYNIMSNCLRGIGDSRSPVIFLGISCVINVCLDMLFVALMGMGVEGAGLATVIAEAISVILSMIYIYYKVPLLKFGRKDYVVDKELLKKTVSFGFLTALQQAAQPIGKLFIQGAINAQGTTAIGAFNVVCRVDDFACIPAQSIGSGIMTGTAQNRGAGNFDRVNRTLRQGFIIGLFYFPLICSVTLLFRLPIARALTPKESTAMIAMAVAALGVKAWVFSLATVVNAVQGHFRGMGKMNIVLISTIIQISIRTIVVYLMVDKLGIVAEAYGTFIGWAAQTVFEYGLYFYLRRGYGKKNVTA